MGAIKRIGIEIFRFGKKGLVHTEKRVDFYNVFWYIIVMNRLIIQKYAFFQDDFSK